MRPERYGSSGRRSADATYVPPLDGSAHLSFLRHQSLPDGLMARRKPKPYERTDGAKREAERRPAKRRVDAPTAATVHPERAPFSPQWIGDGPDT